MLHQLPPLLILRVRLLPLPLKLPAPLYRTKLLECMLVQLRPLLNLSSITKGVKLKLFYRKIGSFPV